MKHTMTIAAALSTAFITTALVVTCSVPSHAQAPPGMVVTWSDEFNGAVGSTPNSGVWNYDTGGGGWGNGELETYVSSQANCHIISDGTGTDNLALQIEAQTDSNHNWYSARINTNGKKTVGPYGYYEFRCKFPNAGQGYWPAGWMLGTDLGSVGWPACGEIDIAEEIDNQENNNGSLHAPNNWNPTAQVGVGTATTAYHNYGANWQPGYVTFYVDGNAYETQTSSSAPGGSWVFDNNPMFLILNLAIGGNWPGYPNSGTQVNGNFDIDYVRQYEYGSAPLPSNGVHVLTPACAPGERLDDSAGGTTNGNHVQIWQSNGLWPQQWVFNNVGGNHFNLAVNAGPYCLDDMGGAQGTQVAVWSCNGGPNQNWTVNSVSGGYQFQNSYGLCLDVNGSGSANGTKVQSWTCYGNSAQTWAVN